MLQAGVRCLRPVKAKPGFLFNFVVWVKHSVGRTSLKSYKNDRK